jgi:hypothetical protein
LSERLASPEQAFRVLEDRVLEGQVGKKRSEPKPLSEEEILKRVEVGFGLWRAIKALQGRDEEGTTR